MDIKAGQYTRRAFEHMSTRVVDEQARVVDFVASTQNVDRVGTRIMGWRTGDFLRNPVILWSHNSQIPPIGRAVGIEQTADGELRIRVQFAPEETFDFAGTVWRLVRDGYLNAGSVGFIPGEVRIPESPDEPIVLADNELLEFSIVPVPANPDALKLAMQRGLIQTEYRDLFARNSAEKESMDLSDEEKASIVNWVAKIREDVQDDPDVSSSDNFQITERRIKELEDMEAELIEYERFVDAINDIFLDPDADELGLDDLLNTIRGYTEERAGAVLSRKNRTALETAVENIQRVLESAGSSEEEKVEEDPVQKSLEEISARLDDLQHTITSRSMMNRAKSEDSVDLFKRLQRRFG